MATKTNKIHDKDENRDPISGEPGAHPVGAGVGAAVGAGAGGLAIGSAAAAIATAAAAGGAVGTAAGPVGTVVGAIAGGIAGGLAGKSIAESIDPTAEDAYWREEYKNRPYYESTSKYEDYQPAYQYGWESRAQHDGRTYDEVEADLERDWAQRKSGLSWTKAKMAVRDAWDRIDGSTTERRRPQKG
jgi:phage tail tape-measure protein